MHNLQDEHIWHPVSLLKDWPLDIQHVSMVALGSVIVASEHFTERWQPTAMHEGKIKLYLWCTIPTHLY